MKDRKISLISTVFDFSILPQGPENPPNVYLCYMVAHYGDSPPLGAKSKNRKQYLCAKSFYLSFKSASLKNIEK